MNSSIRFCLIAAAMLIAWAPIAGVAQETAPAAAKKKEVKATVALTIEFPGDVELTYKSLAFTDGMTVFDAMTEASKQSRGLKFIHKGSGELAFLNEIEGVKNEGAAGKNWTYKVDGQRAKVGMGSMKLKEGSHVLWIFGS